MEKLILDLYKEAILKTANQTRYPHSTAVNDVADILEAGAALVENYYRIENQTAYMLPDLLEKLDYISRKYREQITDIDFNSLGRLERDLHKVQKKINSQEPNPG